MKCFFIIYRMHISIFEVMSIYPIDQYQKAIPIAMLLHELKNVNFMSVSRSWHMILLVIWKCTAWVFLLLRGGVESEWKHYSSPFSVEKSLAF